MELTIKSILRAIFIFSLIFSFNVFAGETGKIAGKVIDKSTKEVLIGASIIITAKWEDGVEKKINETKGASSDLEGEFYILNIPPGEYSVKASYVGYKQEILTHVRVDVDKTTHIEFYLSQETIEGKEVVVTAYSPKTVEKDITATKQVYNVSDVQNIAGVASLTDILELQADVIDDHFRGGRVGESLYLIGGGSIVNPLNNSRAFSPIVTGLQQVEVYTSGFSAEYGNAQSGVVNMVAREGGETWETRIEGSTTPPYYKSFGGSVYSPSNLDFYNILKDTKAWLMENPTQPGRSLFDLGYSFGSVYLLPTRTTLKDSLFIARLGQIAFLTSIRDVGLEYNNTFDTRIDFTTGGPIAKNFKIFVAARQNIDHPIVPTTNPDISRQVMSNLTYEPNQNDKLKFRFVLDSQAQNILTSSWLRWIFDRTLGITQSTQVTKQFGLDWNHLFNQSTVMEMKFNILNVSNQERIELLREGEFLEKYNNKTNWVYYQGPANYYVGRPNDDRGDQKVTTYDFHGNITSQINKSNLLKSGLQLAYYILDVNRDMNIVDAGSYRKVLFKAYPYEGAAYIQDKLEFEGFIANVGLRYDFYNMNANYFADVYSPLRNPKYDPSKPYLERGLYYDRELALREKSKLYNRFQPRVGISFPVSETSVFHLNYGTFTQRPSFNQVFYNQITSFNEIQILGNPRLKPENTKAYDIGLVNAFPYGLKLDVSAYYKDVTNLIETAFYYDEQQSVYQTYINRDYADIKGFHISLEKAEGQLRGYIRYNYEAAKGKSSNDLNAPVTYFEKPAEGQEPVILPKPEDVYLDYDRTHKAIFNLRYKTLKEEGFKVGDFYPLGNLSLSVTFKIYTGRPYTWDITGQGLKYNKRTPTETDLRLRLEKTIRVVKTNMTIYAEGFNLLNTQVYNYSRTFNDERNTPKYELDRANLLTYDEYAPFVTSQEVYLINNQPRYFRLGVILNF